MKYVFAVGENYDTLIGVRANTYSDAQRQLVEHLGYSGRDVEYPRACGVKYWAVWQHGDYENWDLVMQRQFFWERGDKALEMRDLGFKFREIGERLGMTTASARGAVQKQQRRRWFRRGERRVPWPVMSPLEVHLAAPPLWDQETTQALLSSLRMCRLFPETEPSPEVTDAHLVERAVRNAHGGRRWVVVKRIFETGPTASRQLCRRFNLDPEEVV